MQPFLTCVHKCPRASQWNMSSNHLVIICWICSCFISVDKIILYLYVYIFCLHLKFLRVPITYTHDWKYFKSIGYKLKICYGLLYLLVSMNIFLFKLLLFIYVKCIYASCSFFTTFFFILENFSCIEGYMVIATVLYLPISNLPLWVLLPI